MAIIWTKNWTAADDGTVLKAIDLKNIQDDINTTGLADADAIQGFPVDAPTPSDDGKALIYDDGNGTFAYGSLSGLPAGLGPLPYSGASAPAGWLLCYGQAVSRATYADLFTAIGTTYGVGDGSTTFNIPDMRGRTPLGKDNMGGVSADIVTDANADTLGGAVGSETKNIAHTHTTASADIVVARGAGTVPVDDNSGGADVDIIDPHTHTVNSGGSATQNVLNPSRTFNYIIKI